MTLPRLCRTLLMLPVVGLPALGLILPLSSPAVADEATDAMKRADGFYRRNELGKAYKQLENAAAVIARRLSDRYAKAFPSAPAGWRAEPVASTARTKVQLGRGMVLSQLFTTAGKGVARVQMIADDRGIIAGMIENIQRLNKSGRRTSAPIAIEGGGTAYLHYKAGARTAFIGLLVERRFYITVRANRVADPDKIVTSLLAGFDYAALRKAGGLH